MEGIGDSGAITSVLGAPTVAVEEAAQTKVRKEFRMVAENIVEAAEVAVWEAAGAGTGNLSAGDPPFSRINLSPMLSDKDNSSEIRSEIEGPPLTEILTTEGPIRYAGEER